MELIVQRTHGYAYFVQEWGKHTWDAAQQSPITRADVVNGSILATASLDASFFRVRFDRLTPGEKRYAELTRRPTLRPTTQSPDNGSQAFSGRLQRPLPRR